MKITRLEAITLTYSYDAREVWEGWYGPVRQWRSVLVRVHSDMGLTGLGEVTAGSSAPDVAVQTVKYFEPFLVGEDPSQIAELWRRMYTSTSFWGRRGLGIGALSGIEMALWDLAGKAREAPVWALLGSAARDRVPTYASIAGSRDRNDFVKELRDCLEDGFSGVKIRIGYTQQEDLERAELARQTLGDRVKLILDAGQGYLQHPWTVDQAISMAKALSDFSPFWLEEPYLTDDPDGYAAISQAVDYPIAGGENATTFWEFKHLLDKGAMDIIQPDLGHAGGFAEVLHIAALAAARSVAIAPHVWATGVGLKAAIHFAVAVPECLIVEYPRVPNPLREAVITEPIRFIQDCLTVPEAPGLGVALSRDVLQQYAVQVS